MTSPYILLVEDSRTQARMLQFLLEERHYAVRVAEHGQAALEVLRSQAASPWLVLCDVFMPEMNGFELCKHLRATPAWQNLRIVLMTSTHSPAELVSVMECGADAFLTKPIQEELLLQTIAPWNPSRSVPPPPEVSGADLETPLSFQFPVESTLYPVHTTPLHLTHALTSFFLECSRLNRRTADLEREAGEKRLWFDLLLNALPDPAFIVTEQGEILAVNPLCLLALGRPHPTSLTGLPCREAFPKTLFDRFETLKILTTQTRQSVEDSQSLQLPGASGSGCLFLAPLVNRTARIIGYLGLFRPAAPAMSPPSVPVEKIPETLPSPNPPVAPTPQTSVLDIEDGLNRLGGNAAIYAKILRVFYTENQKTPDRVLAALNAGDRETLHRLVHTVKGASGNIGARELFAIAAQTEETIRSANSAVEEPIQVFLKSLARLLETLADVEKLSLK